MDEQRCVLFDDMNNVIGLFPSFKAAHDAWKQVYDGKGIKTYYIGIIARVSEPAAPIVDVNE